MAYQSTSNHTHDAVLLDYCDAGQLWDPVSSAYFYNFDTETSELKRIFPSGKENSSNLTSFLYFDGIWGDFQYPDDHPRQKMVPWFGLKRYVSGPSGPTTKQLIRKGLFPDHPERKSWLQWGVQVYMSLYPCCFRGWRTWLSGIVFVVILICMVFGVNRLLKCLGGWLRSWKNGYKKLNNTDGETDILLDDLADRDSSDPHRLD